MDHFAKDLHDLITKGKSQGYLTYDEVNNYLPDEDVNPEKLDNLLIALDERGIELVDKPPRQEFEQPLPAPSADEIHSRRSLSGFMPSILASSIVCSNIFSAFTLPSR